MRPVDLLNANSKHQWMISNQLFLMFRFNSIVLYYFPFSYFLENSTLRQSRYNKERSLILQYLQSNYLRFDFKKTIIHNLCKN